MRPTSHATAAARASPRNGGTGAGARSPSFTGERLAVVCRLPPAVRSRGKESDLWCPLKRSMLRFSSSRTNMRGTGPAWAPAISQGSCECGGSSRDGVARLHCEITRRRSRPFSRASIEKELLGVHSEPRGVASGGLRHRHLLAGAFHASGAVPGARHDQGARSTRPHFSIELPCVTYSSLYRETRHCSRRRTILAKQRRKCGLRRESRGFSCRRRSPPHMMPGKRRQTAGPRGVSCRRVNR